MLGLGSSVSYGQDSAFLECAKYTDRDLRVRCLEITLTQALKRQEAMANPANSQNVMKDSVQNRPLQRPRDSEVANQGRIETFGRERQPQVVTRNDGSEELLDEVSDLDVIKPNMLDITLDSGQVWRQVYPKRFALKKGDLVRIYPSKWGDDFRLTTSRLSGFIQVSRVK